MALTEKDARELYEMVGAALVAVRNGETAVVAELERAEWLAAVALRDSREPRSRESSPEDALYSSVAYELQVPTPSVAGVLAHRVIFSDSFWALWDASVSSAVSLYAQVAGGRKVAVFGWFDGEGDCEPPEPDKRWLTIAWAEDGGGMGDEIATFVQRRRNGIYSAVDAERVSADARRIADLMNAEADRVAARVAARRGE